MDSSVTPYLLSMLGKILDIYNPSPFISFKNTVIRATEMTHEQDN